MLAVIETGLVVPNDTGPFAPLRIAITKISEAAVHDEYVILMVASVFFKQSGGNDVIVALFAVVNVKSGP